MSSLLKLHANWLVLWFWRDKMRWKWCRDSFTLFWKNERYTTWQHILFTKILTSFFQFFNFFFSILLITSGPTRQSTGKEITNRVIKELEQNTAFP